MYFHSHIKNKVFYLILFFCLPNLLLAQLIVNNSFTTQQLVQNILLGPGVTVSNVTYTGDPNAIGFFNGTATNIGLDSGIVITTGTIFAPDGPQGPNNIGWSGIDNFYAGDPDISIITNDVTFNAAILEFDFVPIADTVQFRYVFGSEEYMEFVGSINDGFGFFISGPGITGTYSNNSKNIALIPGTATPVTINNVNLFTNSQYWFDNENPPGQTIQYDGFTTVLTAKEAVQCGQTYHIKIAIADAFDGVLDSGVFLEAGSFTSNNTFQLKSNVTFSGNDSTLYEGCSTAIIVFDRGNVTSSADTAYFTITGSADNGTDYSFLPNSVYFPAGVDTAALTINSIVDALPEGTESITLTMLQTNACGPNDSIFLTLYITDAPAVFVTASNDTTIYCPNQAVIVSANASGGIGFGGYIYSWNNGVGVGSAVTVNPPVTTTYVVTATDSCGVNTATDSVTIFIDYTPLQLTTSNDATICKGDSIMLIANASDGVSPYAYNWNSGFASGDSILINPLLTTAYNIIVTDSCGSALSKTVNVNVIDTKANFSFSFQSNFIVNFMNQSSPDAVSFNWDFGDNSEDSSSILSSPTHTFKDTGTYLVKLVITNIDGCQDSILKYIVVLPSLYFYFPNAFTPNSDGLDDTFSGYGMGIISYEMMIFNRWGELLYQTTDINKGWNGKTLNGDAKVDTYICVFNVEGERGAKATRFGKISLIR